MPTILPPMVAPPFRQFAALAREELLKAGRPDLSVERSWFSLEDRGYTPLVRVPVDVEYSLTLVLDQKVLRGGDDEAMRRHAQTLARALINLSHYKDELVEYANAVGEAARAELTIMRANGLDVSFRGVDFGLRKLSVLGSHSWVDDQDSILAELHVQRTSSSLRPEITSLIIEDPEDVTTELHDELSDQASHQARKARMEAMGVDLFVDGTTRDLLSAFGVNEVEALRSLFQKESALIDVTSEGQDTVLHLFIDDCTATASIAFPDHNWVRQSLSFREGVEMPPPSIKGEMLGKYAPHPALASRVVSLVASDDRIIPLWRFDAEVGRFWLHDETKADTAGERFARLPVEQSPVTAQQ